MKVAILAGGAGTRLIEETEKKPKPLVSIGGQPILWHIIQHYAHYGFSDFVLALGYKGDMIRQYFEQSVLSNGKRLNIDLVNTGLSTMTGGRIKQLKPALEKETFMLTWCDGVSDVNLKELLEFHRSHGKLATVTAVHPPERFGRLQIEKGQVTQFSEKAYSPNSWVNGAFFVLEPDIFDYIDGNDTQWEKEPMEQLVREGELMAYCHQAFWQCMDTINEKSYLETLWEKNQAPWKVWE